MMRGRRVKQRAVAAGSLPLGKDGTIQVKKSSGSESPLASMIKSVARCVLCDAAYGACDCWATCPTCRWMYERAAGQCERCAS